MPAKRVPIRVTSYYAQLCDHFDPDYLGWYTCNPKGGECTCSKSYYCDVDEDDEENPPEASDEEPSCWTTAIRWRSKETPRFAFTKNGERKQMTHCCTGNESSMKDQERGGLPFSQDAYYLIDGDTVIIDYLDAPTYWKPSGLHKAKHVRFEMDRGLGTGPAVGFRSFSGRNYKIEVDHAANVSFCKMKKAKRKRRPWESDDNSDSDSGSDSSDWEEFEGSGPTPNQTTLFCNEFCRAVMYEAPRLRCFHTMALGAKLRYSFSLRMFAKCILKWKALHMRCIGKKWKPGGVLYNELVKGATAQAMCGRATNEMSLLRGKRKYDNDDIDVEIVLERPMSVQVM